MNRLYYLLFLLLPLVYACDPDEPVAKEEACTDGSPLSQLNCKVGFSEWRIKSVTSDQARPHADGPTRDWAAFDRGCFATSVLSLSGFGPVSDTSDVVVNLFEIENSSSSCGRGLVSTLETDLDFRSATVLYDDDYSSYFYGIPLDDRRSEEETWYDIKFEINESLSFKVDKTFEDVDYRVSVEMESVR